MNIPMQFLTIIAVFTLLAFLYFSFRSWHTKQRDIYANNTVHELMMILSGISFAIVVVLAGLITMCNTIVRMVS